MPIANVTLNNTYDEWRSVTNQLIYFVNDVSESGNLAKFYSNSGVLTISQNISRTSNNYININVSSSILDTSTLNVATANAVNAAHRALLSDIANTETKLDVVSNFANTINVNAGLFFNQANVANASAIAAFTQANTANDNAIAAFTQANNANIRAVAAFTQANTANDRSAAAFTQANTANDRSLAAFVRANASLSNTTSYTLVISNLVITGNVTLSGTTAVLNML